LVRGGVARGVCGGEWGGERRAEGGEERGERRREERRGGVMWIGKSEWSGCEERRGGNGRDDEEGDYTIYSGDYTIYRGDYTIYNKQYLAAGLQDQCIVRASCQAPFQRG
jgi:hypothetical protein